MTEVGSSALREVLLLYYDDLKATLTRRLGSADLAGDVMQDAWIHVQHAKPARSVQSPHPYLLRVAMNIALKRLRRDRSVVTLEEARIASALVDQSPNSAQIAESRSDIVELRKAASELTPSQRDILFSARLEGTPLHELAKRHGISLRTAERELRSAVLHCADRLDRKSTRKKPQTPSGPDGLANR